MRSLSLLTVAMLSTSVHAVTFTVNTSSDLASDNCSGGACSLRGALLAANLTPAEDLIEFNIADTDPGFQASTQQDRKSVV